MTLFTWSQTAADNDDADTSVNLREGWAPSIVNNSIRALMAAVAKWRDDIGGNLVTGGTSTAYTLTTNQVHTAMTDGISVTCRMSATNGASPTLNVDSLGAKAIATVYGTAIPTGALLSGGVYKFTYDSTDDKWIAHGAIGVGARYVGEVFDFAGSTAPTFCLLCYGQAVSRTTYSALYTAIGTTYGTGDGSTTFNVPDCRGRASAGKDDMGGSSANRLTNQSGGLNGDTLGATGGSETHTLTSSEIAAHTHAAGTLANDTVAAHTHGYLHGTGGSGTNEITDVQGFAGADNNSGMVSDADRIGASGSHTHTISGSTASAGSDGAHNNVQPTIVFNKCIFAGA